MVRPTVSVILTSFNYEDFVGKAIESVFEQTWRDLELIIVDDHSTDGSPEIIRQAIAGAPIAVKTAFKRENEGQGMAFNTGFELAEGAYVSFLDSDDYWYPDRMQAVLDFVRLVPDAAIVQHDLETSRGDKRGGLVSGDVFSMLKKWNNGRFNIADDPGGAVYSPFLPTSGLIFPKRVLDRVFPLPPSLVTCPDAFLTRTAIAYGRLASLPLKLGVWRHHERNAGRTDASFQDYWLTTILPELNAYYKRCDLGLEFYFDRAHRSRVPASFMLGEYTKLGRDSTEDGYRRYLSRQSSLICRVASYIRKVGSGRD